MTKPGKPFCFGFSALRRADGKASGHAKILIRKRDAYESLGLRRPPRNPKG